MSSPSFTPIEFQTTAAGAVAQSVYQGTYGMSTCSSMASLTPAAAGTVSQDIYGNGSGSAGCGWHSPSLMFPATRPQAHQAASSQLGVTVLDDASQILLDMPGGLSLGFAPVGASGAGSVNVSGSAFTVPDLWPGTSLRGQAELMGYKETLVVNRWTGRSSWTFRWSGLGLSPHPHNDGSVAWLNSNGQIVGTMPAPTATSVAGETAGGTITVGQSTLTISVSGAWLQQALSEGPVSIDPTFLFATHSCAQCGAAMTREDANDLLTAFQDSSTLWVDQISNNGASGSVLANEYVDLPQAVDLWDPYNSGVNWLMWDWTYETSGADQGQYCGATTMSAQGYGCFWGTPSGHMAWVGGSTIDLLDLNGTGDLVLWQNSDWGNLSNWTSVKSMPTSATSIVSQAFDQSSDTFYAILGSTGGASSLVYMSSSASGSMTVPTPPNCSTFVPLGVAASQGYVAVAGDCGTTVVAASENTNADNGGTWSYTTTHLTDSAGVVSVAYTAYPASDFFVNSATADEDVHQGTALGAQAYGYLADSQQIVALVPPSVNPQPMGVYMDTVVTTQDTCTTTCSYDIVYIQRAIPPMCTVTVPSELSNGSVTVSWSGVAQNGDTPLTYDVDVDDGPVYQSSWLSNTTATSATFSNMTPGHTYSFTCSAIGASGDQGPWSPPQSVTYSPPLGSRSLWTYKTWNLGASGTVRVNVANGNLLYTAVDSSIPTVAGPVKLERDYNSLASGGSPFSSRWSTPLYPGVGYFNSGATGYYFYDGTGAEFTYYYNAQGTLVSPARSLSSRVRHFRVRDLV